MPKLTLLVPALVVACSSPSKPPVEPTPPPPALADAAPPGLAASELCPRLLERVLSTTGTMPPDQVTKLSAVLTEHCNRWPEPVQRCLATEPEDKQGACMMQLDAPARDAFLAAISVAVQEAPDCDDLIDDPERWLPVPDKLLDSDRGLALASMRKPLVASCASWSVPVRQCIDSRKQATPQACFTTPEDAAIRTALDQELAWRGALFTRAAAFAPKDKKIACTKVVAAHYGDAQWKTQLTGRTPADRKRLIKASAKAFGAACTAGGWSAFVRGCIVAAKSADERAACVDPTVWGYPAAAVEQPVAGTASTGPARVPECDAYVALAERFITCDKIPQDSRDAMRQSVDAMKTAWSTASEIPEEARKSMREACTQGAEALKQAATTAGCPL